MPVWGLGLIRRPSVRRMGTIGIHQSADQRKIAAFNRFERRVHPFPLISFRTEVGAGLGTGAGGRKTAFGNDDALIAWEIRQLGFQDISKGPEPLIVPV